MSRTSNDALRLLASTKAVAEKLAALRTERYFRERAERGDLADFWSILEGPGDGRAEPPPEGDERPA